MDKRETDERPDETLIIIKSSENKRKTFPRGLAAADSLVFIRF